MKERITLTMAFSHPMMAKGEYVDIKGKTYKVLSNEGTSAVIRPARWYDSVARFCRRYLRRIDDWLCQSVFNR